MCRDMGMLEASSSDRRITDNQSIWKEKAICNFADEKVEIVGWFGASRIHYNKY